MIHLVCALHCEARPLIERYRLQRRDAEDLYPVYIDRRNSLSLTVSGIGKVNAAAATACSFMALESRRSDAWLNVGIAAHETIAVGEAVLAQCICDVSNRKSWYPQILFDAPCQRATLLTLDMPSSRYLDKLYDMEAAGFYETASRFATAELVHVVKVISDNATRPAKRIDEAVAEKLIQDRLDVLADIISTLARIADELGGIQALPPFYTKCLDNWHFTRYQQQSLQQLLRRWKVLCPDDDPLSAFAEINKAADVLDAMQAHLDTQSIEFV